MGIDRVLILNLPYNIQRRWACYSANVINGVPERAICIWKAIPGDNFESIAEMVENAAADGFPELLKLYDAGQIAERDRTDTYGYRVTAQFWSYCQMLREIAKGGENTVILYDDRYIRNFGYIDATVSHLSEKNLPPFEILQFENNLHNAADPRHFMNPKPHPKFPWFYQGPLGGSENAMFFTPKGAAFLLEYLLENFGPTTETTILKMNENLEAYPYFWTADFPIVGMLEFLGTNIHKDLPNAPLLPTLKLDGGV